MTDPSVRRPESALTPATWKPRVQDALWVLLFFALHASSPIVNDAEEELLFALALFEIASPRWSWLTKPGMGQLASVSIRLVLSYLLIGVTGGIASSYYLLLLLPVVAAASTFGWIGTLFTTSLAAASYLSFILFLDFSTLQIPPDQQQEISFRILFLFLAAYLTHQLARKTRQTVVEYQQLAVELRGANENLHTAQEEVRRSERLAALGQLTAGLAHELRNPLGTIKNSAELLTRRNANADPVAKELTGFISSEVDRANELVRRFLDFARPFRLRLEPLDLSELVDQAIQQVASRADQHEVTLYRNDSPELAPLLLDSQWMQVLLTNLLSNAIDASPAGSMVSVVTKPAEGGAELSVIDRGAGISPEHVNSIFNPFFTTKSNGTGMGLAIVSKIVDEHRGRIHVESVPGEGTTFRVWLPDRLEAEETTE